jgi:hypothetical protein
MLRTPPGQVKPSLTASNRAAGQWARAADLEKALAYIADDERRPPLKTA